MWLIKLNERISGVYRRLNPVFDSRVPPYIGMNGTDVIYGLIRDSDRAMSTASHFKITWSFLSPSTVLLIT